MARPKLPDCDLHERSYRIRLSDLDADIVDAIARKADIPRAVMLRAWVVDRINREFCLGEQGEPAGPMREGA